MAPLVGLLVGRRLVLPFLLLAGAAGLALCHLKPAEVVHLNKDITFVNIDFVNQHFNKHEIERRKQKEYTNILNTQNSNSKLSSVEH